MQVEEGAKTGRTSECTLPYNHSVEDFIKVALTPSILGDAWRP